MTYSQLKIFLMEHLQETLNQVGNMKVTQVMNLVAKDMEMSTTLDQLQDLSYQDKRELLQLNSFIIMMQMEIQTDQDTLLSKKKHMVEIIKMQELKESEVTLTSISMGQQLKEDLVQLLITQILKTIGEMLQILRVLILMEEIQYTQIMMVQFLMTHLDSMDLVQEQIWKMNMKCKQVTGIM